MNLDGFVKTPSAALRCILRHCSVPISTHHSSEFARLASEAFYFAISILTFYELINLDLRQETGAAQNGIPMPFACLNSA